MAKSRASVRSNIAHGEMSLKELLLLVGALVILLLVVSFFSAISGPSGYFSRTTTECGDSIDNDGDALADTRDPGCANRKDISELGTVQCDNGLDDDSDGFIDAKDKGCTSPNDKNERSPVQCDNGL